jgi:hypothetical protein
MGSDTDPMLIVSNQSFRSGIRLPRPSPATIATTIQTGRYRLTRESLARAGSVSIEGVVVNGCCRSLWSTRPI